MNINNIKNRKIIDNIIIPRRKRHSLVDWMLMKERDVINEFANLPNAKVFGKGDACSVLIPGTRTDRVALVAHADTVWDNADIPLVHSNGMYFSTDDSIGIGADDRAGIGMVWHLRNLGHTVFIPNGEESGCIGSNYFKEKHRDAYNELNEHQFIIEMDRMNSKDLVSYNVGSLEFSDWCENKFTGYKRASGSWTDICVLCRDICGLNISVGYYNQHSSTEFLRISEWNRTLSHLFNVLSNKDLPKFKQPVYIKPKKKKYRPIDNSSTTVVRKYLPPIQNNNNSIVRVTNVSTSGCATTNSYNNNDIEDNIIICPNCDLFQDVFEWKKNNQRCILCKESF
jgi:hypothetical protein